MHKNKPTSLLVALLLSFLLLGACLPQTAVTTTAKKTTTTKPTTTTTKPPAPTTTAPAPTTTVPAPTTTTTAPPATTTTAPPAPAPTPSFPVRPGVVYTRADIDAWSTRSPEYTRLAGSWAGKVARPHTSYGTEISSVERDLLKDESGYMKTQAVLWAADGDPARRAKVVAMLDELRTVTSWQRDTAEQYRLVAGWSCTNVAQAASIIEHHDPQLRRFLAETCYPILDWPQNPNWHASFADSKLAIAAYVGDPALWKDAKAYFNTRIAQSIYHAGYDGKKVAPLHGSTGTVSYSHTLAHWGNNTKSAGAQVHRPGTDYVFVDPALAVSGANAERQRDLGHVSMGLGAWMHGARTILAQGEQLEPHARARLLAGYEHHAGRVLTHLDTGVIPFPAVKYPPASQTSGDGSRFQGLYGARKLFGAQTPAAVTTLLTRPSVSGYPAAGANHLVAEAFADG